MLSLLFFCLVLGWLIAVSSDSKERSINTDGGIHATTDADSKFSFINEELTQIAEHEGKIKQYQLVLNTTKEDNDRLKLSLILGNIGILYRELDLRWKKGEKNKYIRYFNDALHEYNVYNSTGVLSEVEWDENIMYTTLLGWKVSISQILGELGNVSDATVVYDDTLRFIHSFAPSESVKNYDLATVLHSKGDLNLYSSSVSAGLSTLSIYNESIKHDPCNFRAYYSYIIALKAREQNQTNAYWKNVYETLKEQIFEYLSDDDDNYALREECLARNAGMTLKTLSGNDFGKDTNDLVLGYWALYEAAQAAHEVDDAWSYLNRAHAMVHKGADETDYVKYNLDHANFVMSSYPREYFPAVSFQIGSESTVPVFIIGFFRSGSTLLETMLDAHRDVYSVAEYSSFAYQSMKMIEIMDSKKYQLKDPHVLKSIVAKTAKNTLRMMRRKLRDTHQGDISLTNNSKIIDKMLFNYKNLALIHLIFPNAVILHTVRDPMDTLFSCYKTKFRADTPWLHNRGILALEYAIYLKIMHHFKTILPPGRIIDVSYEELVMNPTKVMKTVVKDALQLPWDPSVLEYHKLNRTVHTASVLQVKQKLYKDSIGGWTKYSRELRDIKHELKKHLPVLAAQGALEPAYLNWELDSTFNYKDMLSSLSSSKRKKMQKHLKLTGYNYVNNTVVLSELESLIDGMSTHGVNRLRIDSVVEEHKVLLNKMQALVKKGLKYVYYGQLDATRRDYNEALYILDYVKYSVTLNNIKLIPLTEYEYDMYFLKAKLLVLMSNGAHIPEAISIFNHLLSMKPENLDIYYELTECYRYYNVDGVKINQGEWRSLLNRILTGIAKQLGDGVFVSQQQAQEIVNNENYDHILHESNEFTKLRVQYRKVYHAAFFASHMINEYLNAWRFLDRWRKLEKLALRAVPHVDYSFDNTIKGVEFILSFYSQSFFPQRMDSTDPLIGSTSTVPIFIVGFRRSGGNLLSSMLASHQNILSITDEDDRSMFNSTANAIVRELVDMLNTATSLGRDSALTMLNAIVTHHGNNIVGTIEKLIKFDAIRKKYVDVANRYGTYGPKLKFVDNVMDNYKNLALIHLIFPNAVILHTVRDPMDTLFSCYKTKFNRMDKHVYALDLKHLTLEYAIYLKIMHHFKTILPPGRIIDVSYEELVMNPTKVMKAVVKDALQLPWDPSVLEYHKLNRTVHTASVLQVKQKLYKDSIGGWTKYSRELRDIKHELKKHLPVLAAQGALEPAYLNWELDSTFNYKEMLKAFKDIY